jgi:hypothetical protein
MGAQQIKDTKTKHRVKAVGKIFLSYRREDSPTTAGRIQDWLVQRVPKKDVFFDIDSIQYGIDFERRIQQTIPHCKAVLAIIGPRWFTEDGHPSRQVVAELELASRSGVQIIPVLVEGGSMPPQDRLPQSLQRFFALNAAQVRSGRDFRHDIEDLAKTLGIPIAPRSPLSIGSPGFWVATMTAVVLLALGIMELVNLAGARSTDPYAAATLTAAVANRTADTAAVRNATAVALAKIPYKASVPGPGCDQSGGHWVNPDSSSAMITCANDGMHLFDPSDSATIGRIDFDWPDHPFPSNYTVGVEAFNLSTNTCVGIRTRNFGVHGYGFWVCTQGIWIIYKIDDAGNRQRVTSGQLASTNNTSFRLVVAANGATQSFTIITADNTRTTATLIDSSYNGTSYVSLSAYGTENADGSAVFTNFVYTPEP